MAEREQQCILNRINIYLHRIGRFVAKPFSLGHRIDAPPLPIVIDTVKISLHCTKQKTLSNLQQIVINRKTLPTTSS